MAFFFFGLETTTPLTLLRLIVVALNVTKPIAPLLGDLTTIFDAELSAFAGGLDRGPPRLPGFLNTAFTPNGDAIRDHFRPCPFFSSCPNTEPANFLASDGVGFFAPLRIFDASVDVLELDCFLAISILL